MAFNVDDYITNTLHLTTRQHGAYILLICAAWKAKGVLPGADAALMATAKLTPKEWREDGPILKAFLTRRGDEWIHERVMFEWNEAQSLIAAKSNAGRKGARKRWHGRTNGSAMPAEKQSQCPEQWQNDAHLQEHLQQVTTTESVANSARTRASQSGRAVLITEEWQPDEALIGQLRKGRPDLVGKLFDDRMQDFRLWCREKATTSHDPAATWLGFMRKTKTQEAVEGEDWNSRRIRLAREAVRQ
ncbi:MAG: DUF1376 domain-containing protein [Pseudomonadota bacterium]